MRSAIRRQRHRYYTSRWLRRILVLARASWEPRHIVAPFRYRRHLISDGLADENSAVPMPVYLRPTIYSRMGGMPSVVHRTHNSRSLIGTERGYRLGSTGQKEPDNDYQNTPLIPWVDQFDTSTVRAVRMDGVSAHKSRRLIRSATSAFSDRSSRISAIEPRVAFVSAPVQNHISNVASMSAIMQIRNSNMMQSTSYVPPLPVASRFPEVKDLSISARSDVSLPAEPIRSTFTEQQSSDGRRPKGSTLHIDGAALGRWTLDHVTRALSKPSMGLTRVDPRATAPRTKVAPF